MVVNLARDTDMAILQVMVIRISQGFIQNMPQFLISGLEEEDDDVGYETFNVTYVDPTDYSDANYNSLLFPFLHPFKFASDNDTEVETEEVCLCEKYVIL